MKITRSVVDGKRVYDLVWSKEDFDHFCAGCPEMDSVLGRHDDVYFQIFNGTRIPEAFRYIATGGYNTYAASLGLSAPLILSDSTVEDVDRLTQEFCDSLEKAINESGEIPMVWDDINVGYVRMKVAQL